MAVTFDYGQCPQCNESNPKSLAFCRSCGTGLPWAKPAKAPKPTVGSGGGGGGFSMGDVEWGPMAIQLFGGAVFVLGAVLWCGNVFGFFPTFRFAGYLTMLVGGGIWRAGSGE